MIRIVFVVSLTLGSTWANAQFLFKQLNTASGLSNNTVLTILQDRQGFIWFGTDDGLNKYDGHTFRVFKPDFKSKKGISHNIAKTLFEDHAGNIWIGTDGGGLNKFDPITEKFTHFYAEEGNLIGLNHNNITALAEEGDQYLWIGTYGGGLNRLDLKTNTFEHFVNEPENPNTVASFFINSLMFDHEGNLWIGTWGRGLDRLDVRTMTFTNFQHHADDASSLSDNTVNCTYLDHKKRIWVGTWEGGLGLFHPQTQTFTSFSQREKNLSVNNIRCISEDIDGNLWLGSFGSGLTKFSVDKKGYQQFQHRANDATSICSNNLWTSYFSSDNILWIGSIEGGISKLDFNKKKFLNQRRSEDDNKQEEVVDAFLENKNGDIWIGTFGRGLQIVDADLQLKKSHESIPLLSDKVTSMIEDSRGNYWICTDGGVTTYNPKTHQYKNYVIAGAKPGLSFSVAKVVYEDRSGTIWIGTWGGGLNRYDRNTDTFKFYFPSPKRKVKFTVDMGELPVSPNGIFLAGNFNKWNTRSIPMKQVGSHIYQVTLELAAQRIEFRFLNGDAWERVPATCALGKNRTADISENDLDIGVIKFGLGCSDTKQLQNLNFSNGIVDGHILSIIEDSEGMLWIGTNEGLSRFDNVNDIFTNFKHGINDSLSLSDNHVSCIYEDTDHKLWIGTLGGGLNYFDRTTNTFTNYSEKDGLANNIVKSILEDSHHNLWIGTNNGLSKFNTHSREFKNYNEANALSNSSFRMGAALKRKNGEMLFGGVHGITRFSPDSVSSNLWWPKVYITDVLLFGQALVPGQKVGDEVLLDSAILYKNNIALDYDQNMLSFKFSSPEFTDNVESTFSYRLEGFDKRWFVSNTPNHMASYTNLPPGDYTFKVRVANQEGEYGSSQDVLQISIAPPFWATVYFKIFVAIIFACSLYVSYRVIAAKKEAKLRQATLMANQKIKELENEKLQNEIDYKNRELANISMNLMEKTKFLNEQIKRLENIANISERDVKSKLNNLIENFHKEITTEKDWEYFELHFDKVHQNFIANLKVNFPELSATDIRLAAFIRMDLSNKEIAELMNKSVRSIESSRYRLRKSLNLRQGDNLTDFLFRL